MVGRTGGTDIGMVSIQCRQKDSLSSANYTVRRIKQDVLKQSGIGRISISKNDANDHNFVYGVVANSTTSELFGDKNLKMGMAISQSYIQKQSNQANLGYKAYVTYPNDFVQFNLYMITVENKFNHEIKSQNGMEYKQAN